MSHQSSSNRQDPRLLSALRAVDRIFGTLIPTVRRELFYALFKATDGPTQRDELTAPFEKDEQGIWLSRPLTPDELDFIATLAVRVENSIRRGLHAAVRDSLVLKDLYPDARRVKNRELADQRHETTFIEAIDKYPGMSAKELRRQLVKDGVLVENEKGTQIKVAESGYTFKAKSWASKVSRHRGSKAKRN